MDKSCPLYFKPADVFAAFSPIEDRTPPIAPDSTRHWTVVLGRARVSLFQNSERVRRGWERWRQKPGLDATLNRVSVAVPASNAGSRPTLVHAGRLVSHFALLPPTVEDTARI